MDSDDDTQDVFPDAQDLFTDEEWDIPATPPHTPPIITEDYLDRVKRECNEREADEFERQKLIPGYMRTLHDLFDEIDEWLSIEGGIPPFPHEFRRFARHNWCIRLLPIKERVRISKLRLKLDIIILEEQARQEAAFWEQVEQNEPNARVSIPLCSICQFDLRNESFDVNRLSCTHMFHERCITTHFESNVNPMCPNCNTPMVNAGERTRFNYQ